MKIECNQGSSGVWSWCFKSDNGTLVAKGVKTFETQEEAKKAVAAFGDSVGVKAKDVSFVPLFPDAEKEAGE